MRPRPCRWCPARTGWCWSRSVCWYSWRRTGAISFPGQPGDRAKPAGCRTRSKVGGEGTAEVFEFAAAELGAQLETTAGSAKALMADALDLRHRLPELWQLMCLAGAGVAGPEGGAGHPASEPDCGDACRCGGGRLIAALPWGRFETMLAAKIIEADPRAAEEQAKIWEAERFVRAGRTGQSGLKLLIAKANAGDVIWFMATVNRIAEILRLQGDLDSADVRRSRAIGILAQPALALHLLWEFRNEQRPAAEPQQPDEPIDNDPEAPLTHCRLTDQREATSPVATTVRRTDALVDHPAVRVDQRQAAAAGDAAYPSQPRGAAGRGWLPGLAAA